MDEDDGILVFDELAEVPSELAEELLGFPLVPGMVCASAPARITKVDRERGELTVESGAAWQTLNDLIEVADSAEDD